MNTTHPTVDSLTDALRSEDGLERQAARTRLVALGHAVTRAMCRLLDDPERQVRWEAATSLRDIADPDSVPALARAVLDDDKDVRWVAAEALGAIGEPGMKALVELLVQDPSSPEVQTAFQVGARHVVDLDLRGLLEPLRESVVRRAPAGVITLAAARVLDVLPA